jgi:ankyrin repeat protein
MKGNRNNFDVDALYPLVIKLTAATESGDAAKVKRLLRNLISPGVRAKAASLVLSSIDPLENPTLSAERLWNWDSDAHNKKDKRPGKRALHSAWQRISRTIDILLDAGADAETMDSQGCPVLCKIVNHRNLVKILQRLLDAGANPNSDDGTGATALYLAVMCNNEEGVRLLLEHGADPGVPYEGLTPLMSAASNQQLGILRKLINTGADLNSRDKDGRSALMHALHQHGDKPFLVTYRWAREAEARRCPKEASLGITRLLVESGAEYEKPDTIGFFPADYALAARLNGVELPEQLAVKQTYLKFCEAAMAGDSRQLTALLASAEIPTRIKSIALTLAAVRGFEECCKTLLENGADANKFNQCGISPAKAAATGLQLPIMRLLVAHGLSKEGLSAALIDVCMVLAHYYELEESTFHRKRLELARYLLEQGADPNTQDKDCGDLLTIATIFEKNVELVGLLREFGAVSQA